MLFDYVICDYHDMDGFGLFTSVDTSTRDTKNKKNSIPKELQALPLGADVRVYLRAVT